MRRKNFFDTFETVKRHNQAFDEGNVTFKLGINQLSDVTLAEFMKLNEVPFVEVPFGPLNYSVDGADDFPSSFDWRDRNAVSKIKDQRLCGACYAFAAISALESHIFIKTGNKTDLSVQEILECTGDDYQSWGCEGGIVFRVFDYIQENGGISFDSDYPFEENHDNSSCRSSSYSKFGIDIKGYSFVVSDDEAQMRRTISKVGPIIGLIAISNEEFLRYSSGIFIQKNCTASETNHALLLIGYGEENGTKYWIAQNSYGANWGDSGYIKVATRRASHCGIETEVFFPIL